MSKILTLNFNISKIFFTYFEFYMVVILRKLKWWYKAFYFLSKEHWFSRFKFSKLITYLMENSMTHVFCYFILFFLIFFLSKTQLFIVRRWWYSLSFLEVFSVWIFGVSTGWSGSGLCPTHNWPAYIEWTNEWPATDRQRPRVKSDQSPVDDSRVGRPRY